MTLVQAVETVQAFAAADRSLVYFEPTDATGNTGHLCFPEALADQVVPLNKLKKD